MKNTNLSFKIGFLFFMTLCGVGAFSPLLMTHSHDYQDLAHLLESPSWAHFFGTDSLGRDLYSRCLRGLGHSLSLGFYSAILSLFLGSLFGCLAAFFRGWIDLLILRVFDLFQTVPSILIAILLSFYFGRHFLGILVSVGLSSWVFTGRLVRGEIIRLMALPRIESARAIGITPYGLLKKHLLPDMAGIVLVSLTLAIPSTLLSESLLSFLGLGLSPPEVSLGSLSAEGFRSFRFYPHLSLWPGLVLSLVLGSFYLIGHGLKKRFINSSDYRSI